MITTDDSGITTNDPGPGIHYNTIFFGNYRTGSWYTFAVVGLVTASGAPIDSTALSHSGASCRCGWKCDMSRYFYLSTTFHFQNQFRQYPNCRKFQNTTLFTTISRYLDCRTLSDIFTKQSAVITESIKIQSTRSGLLKTTKIRNSNHCQ